MIHIYKYLCNWAAQKQADLLKTDLSILPICINTHGQYTTPTCPKCAYKISQIFSRVFEFALADKPRNPRNLMYNREYFRVYIVDFMNVFFKEKQLHTGASNYP